MSNDPLIDRLARFNPASSSIDRDAMLFAAGQASARRSRVWKALAVTLACSQAVLLAFWITQASSALPRPSSTPGFADMPEAGGIDQVAGAKLAANSYGNLMRQAAAGELPAPLPAVDSIQSRSILSTDSSSLNSLLE